MTGFTAVLIYIAWTLALTMLYAFPRVPQILLGRKRADSWERNQPSIDPVFMVRAKGAHLNCVENFPLFAGVVCVAALMNRSAVVDSVAAIFIAARLAQSTAHLIGTNLPLIGLRATLFLVQVLLMFYMVWQLLH